MASPNHREATSDAASADSAQTKAVNHYPQQVVGGVHSKPRSLLRLLQRQPKMASLELRVHHRPVVLCSHPPTEVYCVGPGSVATE